MLSKKNLEIDAFKVIEEIKKFIQASVNKAKVEGVVIGISGGIDSAIVASLCVSALGEANILGLIMPSSTSDPDETEDAKLMAQQLGIKYKIIDITPLVEKFLESCEHRNSNNKLVIGNLKPRIRMTLLYYHANLLNSLVVGTGNKSELLTGYFTKYGDGGVDLLPIGDLYKTQVRQLADHLKIPKRIRERVPTASLYIGQTDEGELGIKYADLDLILYGLVDLQMIPEEITKKIDVKTKDLQRVLSLIHKSRHKRSMPQIFKLKGDLRET